MALNSVLRVSLEPTSLQEQMHRILGLILHLPWLALEAKGCIFLAEGGAQALAMKAQIGMPPGALSVCARVPFGQCLCGQAIAAGEVVFANCVDGRHDTRYPGMVPHGHYCVPIASGGRPVGLLNLYVQEGHRHSPEEERFLRAVADVLAGVIERKQTEERLQEQLRLAAFGRDVGQALSQADSLPDMLRRCAEAMVRHLDGALARIWTLHEAEDVLELQASAGLYTHTDGAHRRVPVDRYKIGRIAQERRPHLTNGVPIDPRVHDREWARREGLVAFAGYPLLVEDRLVGVMALFARRPLSEATLEAMASVANAAALGVERQRSERARRQAERRLAAEHPVSRVLAVSSTLSEAAPAILRAVCESLGWDVGVVWGADRGAGVLRCAELWHRPEVAVAAFEEDTRRRTFAPGVGVPGRVWADEQLVWAPDVSADVNYPRRQAASQCGLHGAGRTGTQAPVTRQMRSASGTVSLTPRSSARGTAGTTRSASPVPTSMTAVTINNHAGCIRRTRPLPRSKRSAAVAAGGQQAASAPHMGRSLGTVDYLPWCSLIISSTRPERCVLPRSPNPWLGRCVCASPSGPPP
jgi:GAF domain-containing protein